MITPIALMGFKHVGKSILAHHLASQLNTDFIDLDQALETHYQESHHEPRTCRQIVQSHGVDFFRALEHQTLQTVLATHPTIIALGGGTPLNVTNHALLKALTLVHVRVPPDIVFARIMQNNADFFGEEEPHAAFQRLWHEREPVYQSLQTIIIDNVTTPADACTQLLKVLKEYQS